MDKEANSRFLAQEEAKKRKMKEVEINLAQRKEAYEKRVENHRKYNVVQKLREIRDQVWQKGDLQTAISHCEGFEMDSVSTALSFSTNFTFADYNDVDIGGSGSIESYRPNTKRVYFRRVKTFFTGLRVDVLPDSLVIKEAAYIIGSGDGDIDLEINSFFGNPRRIVHNEFFLYGFEPEVSRISLSQHDIESSFEKTLLDSCIRRKEKGLAPIDLGRILDNKYKDWSISSGETGIYGSPPFIRDWSWINTTPSKS